MFVKSFVRRNGPLEREEEICFQQNMSLEKDIQPKTFYCTCYTEFFFPKRFEVNGRVISCLIVAAAASVPNFYCRRGVGQLITMSTCLKDFDKHLC